MTRIISGQARGRRLSVPSAGTRPTSDRVREALFSALDSHWREQDMAWRDIVVLDLYAGTGALGLEALSRGARSAVLVERNRAAARTMSQNVEVVACPGATVLVRDAAQLASTPPPHEPANLVFADPPYDVPAATIAGMLDALLAAGWIRADATIVVERPERDPQTPLPAGWRLDRRRPYGDTALWYGRAAAQPDETAGKGTSHA
jgi:16S rRNA (guanine966-N2)-methyltransferase